MLGGGAADSVAVLEEKFDQRETRNPRGPQMHLFVGSKNTSWCRSEKMNKKMNSPMTQIHGSTSQSILPVFLTGCSKNRNKSAEQIGKIQKLNKLAEENQQNQQKSAPDLGGWGVGCGTRNSSVTDDDDTTLSAAYWDAFWSLGDRSQRKLRQLDSVGAEHGTEPLEKVFMEITIA